MKKRSRRKRRKTRTRAIGKDWEKKEEESRKRQRRRRRRRSYSFHQNVKLLFPFLRFIHLRNYPGIDFIDDSVDQQTMGMKRKKEEGRRKKSVLNQDHAISQRLV